MALHRSCLHYTAASTGGLHKGQQRGKYGFNIWDMPGSAFQDLPALTALPLELSKFACTYLRKSLDLPPPADSRGKRSFEELNGILLQNLVEDKGGQHIRTWGTLELQCDLCLGVQGVCCFPFSTEKAWKRNPMQYVAMIPPKKYTGISFSGFDNESTCQMQIIGVSCGLIE